MQTRLTGSLISNAIQKIMEEKKITSQQLMGKLGRKPELFTRFLYDVKNGNMTIKTLEKIASALETEVWEIINKKYYVKGCDFDMDTLLQRGKSLFNSGDVVDVPKLLCFIWESLNFGDRQKIGKEIYADVMRGMYSSVIKFHHKDSSNHAYYTVV